MDPPDQLRSLYPVLQINSIHFYIDIEKQPGISLESYQQYRKTGIYNEVSLKETKVSDWRRSDEL
jgi:hypothetical protein